jgi:hypothetical protein
MARTPQTPIPSGHGAKTTARELIGDRRLDGIIAVVTGGYTGIGLETTRVLADAGALVIVHARSLDKPVRPWLTLRASNSTISTSVTRPPSTPSQRDSRRQGGPCTCS